MGTRFRQGGAAAAPRAASRMTEAARLEEAAQAALQQHKHSYTKAAHLETKGWSSSSRGLRMLWAWPCPPRMPRSSW